MAAMTDPAPSAPPSPAAAAAAPAGEPARQIVYIADPMCSWCWGFSPVIAAIAERAAGRAALTLVMGGLRPGSTKPMSPAFKADVRHHWEAVAEASGQPFGFDFFERDGFVYDTEPPCRAVVTVRELKPEAAFAFLAAVQRAFYADNRDVTDAAVLGDLARAAGVDGDAFAAAFASDAMAHRTRDDFHFARALGIDGFPAVVVRDGRGDGLLTLGFRPFDALEAALEAWLAG